MRIRKFQIILTLYTFVYRDFSIYLTVKDLQIILQNGLEKEKKISSMNGITNLLTKHTNH